MRSPEVSADQNVIEFVRECTRLTDFDSPSAQLVYGRFRDEAENHFRIAIIEQEQVRRMLSAGARVVQIPGMLPLVVEATHFPYVRGKRMVLDNDIINFVSSK